MEQARREESQRSVVAIDEAKQDDVSGAVRVSAEKAVLGSILVAPDVLPSVAERLRPEMFYRVDHREIFGAMLAVWSEQGAIDSGLVDEKLRDSGKRRKGGPGWNAYFSELMQSIPVACELAPSVRLVRSAYQRRELQGMVTGLQKRMKDPATDALGELERMLEAATKLMRETSEDGRDNYLAGAVELENAYLRPILDSADGKPPIQSGFTDFDDETGGFHPDAYVVLAGRSGVGKSILSLNLARHMAGAGKHVAFIALEMSNRETFCRILSAISGVPTAVLLARTLDRHHWEKASAGIAQLDGMRLKTFERIRALADIQRTARALKSAGRLDVLFVDTVHLVTAPGSTYDRSVAVSVALRALAIELGILVVGVAQFSGGYDEQTSQRPQRHWIKGGTHMFQDATDVLLMHRPDPLVGKVELILEKRRHGRPGKIVNIAFLEDIARFENWTNREGY